MDKKIIKKKWILMLLCMIGLGHADAKEQLEQPSVNFLVFADIHFDPFITCGNVTPCKLIEKLSRAGVTEWAALLASYDTQPPAYKQDTNFPLFKSTLTAAREVAAKNQVQFVLILGDFLGHQYRRKFKKYATDPSLSAYYKFVRKTLEFINLQFKQNFPNQDIYSVVGNNDSYQGDFVVKPQGLFFREIADTWSDGIRSEKNRAEMQTSFARNGYYAITIPDQPLRLIVLNSTYFAREVRGKNLDEATNEQLNWLHQQLTDAKNKQQKVLIAMHIPEGVDVFASMRFHFFPLIELWLSTYLERFQAELKLFAPTIVAVFTGHLHADWYQIFRFENLNEIPAFGNPSISPIFETNPGFKLYMYSPQTSQLKDFITYYYPINKSKIWQEAYDFKRWSHATCQHCSMLDSLKRLQQSDNPLFAMNPEKTVL